jgi:hypothetical protein
VLAACAAPNSADPRRLADIKPEVVSGPARDDIPIRLHRDIVLLEVDVNGSPLSMTLDTGSPTVIPQERAEELGVERLGTIEVDGGGRTLRMEAAVVQELTVGRTVFANVPVLVADMDETAGRCLSEGILGSELLPLRAWRVDVPNRRLELADSVDRFTAKELGKAVALRSFGYPHSPFAPLWAAGGDISITTMIDTGSGDAFSLSPPDFNAARGLGALDEARAVRGIGVLGGNPDGPSRPELLVGLPEVRLGGVALGSVATVTSPRIPSAIGAPLLAGYAVTFDFANARLHLAQAGDAEFGTFPSFGFSMTQADDPAEGFVVTFLWEDSPAHRENIAPGERILVLNGLELTDPTADPCALVRKASELMHETWSLALVVADEDGNERIVLMDREDLLAPQPAG